METVPLSGQRGKGISPPQLPRRQSPPLPMNLRVDPSLERAHRLTFLSRRGKHNLLDGPQRPTLSSLIIPDFRKGTNGEFYDWIASGNP